jgi:hypothetical protein
MMPGFWVPGKGLGHLRDVHVIVGYRYIPDATGTGRGAAGRALQVINVAVDRPRVGTRG